MFTRVFFILLIFGFPALSFAEISRPLSDEMIKILPHFAIVGFSWVDQPLTRVILIRTKTALCGVRFTAVKKDTLPNAATVLTSGGLYEYADADVVVQNRHDLSDLKNLIPTKISLSFEGLIGVGHLSSARGNNYIKCGVTTQPLVSSFPRRRESSDSAEYNFRIELDSRLRGNDGVKSKGLNSYNVAIIRSGGSIQPPFFLKLGVNS